jgi:RNA polymerase sigma-70 factor (ECF subfamily)
MAPTSTDFERALHEHFDVLYRMARSLLGDAEGVEDLVQDASLRALRAFDELEHHENLRSWFARVVYTCFLDGRRYERRRPSVPLDEYGEDVELRAAELSTWEPAILRNGFEDELEAHLARLPAGSRAVLQLVDVEGFSYQEVSQALDLPIGTVRSRLFRARRTLYRALRPDGDAQDVRTSSAENPQ